MMNRRDLGASLRGPKRQSEKGLDCMEEGAVKPRSARSGGFQQSAPSCVGQSCHATAQHRLTIDQSAMDLCSRL